MSDQHLTESTGRIAPFAIGIDLGTSNSVMAVAGIDMPGQYLPGSLEGSAETSLPKRFPLQLLKLTQQKMDGTSVDQVLFPSVVFQETKDSPRLIGEGARDAKFSYPQGKQVFYSAKRYLGISRDPFYPNAVSEELNSPWKISAIILSAMKKAAEKNLGGQLDNIPTIITVPASFQSAQRRDTLQAARLAHFTVDESSLLDEPNAALLGFLHRKNIRTRWYSDETVLIFDFGGGTCDISIVETSCAPVSQAINLKNLAISRYEELGGDDIDRHIAHTYLMDQFYKSSGKPEREWSYAERKNSIWSQLYKIAELLKIRFCEELDKCAQASQWDEMSIKGLQVGIPPQPINTSEGSILLTDLSLSWDQFNRVMQPFLDSDCANNKDLEYYRITSIFTPILDAIDKAGLETRDITRILLVGGSSYNPLVEHAIHQFFSEADIERTHGLDFLVAEGAALYAYFKYINGQDILKPILGDTIGLLVEGKHFVSLAQAGASIPYPNENEWQVYTHFRVPRDLMREVDLVICAGSAIRPIHTVKLKFNTIIPANTPVHLKVRLDGNKIFHLEAFLPDYPDISVSESIQNPLSQLPQTKLERQRVLLENQIIAAKTSGTIDQVIPEMVDLSRTLQQAGQNEQALEWINTAIRRSGESTIEMRSQQASCYYRMGEDEKAHQILRMLSDENPTDSTLAFNAAISASDLKVREDYFQKAYSLSPTDGTILFMLGVTLDNSGKIEEGRAMIEKACSFLEAKLKQYPNHLNIMYWLIEVYEYLGQNAQADQLRIRYSEAQKQGIEMNTDNLIGVTNAIQRR